MEYIILLIFSFFTEAVILWQYAASLFSPSHSGKKRLTLLSVPLCTVVFSFPAWANMAEYYQFFCDKHCFPLYNV